MNEYLSPFCLHHIKQEKIGKFSAGVNMALLEMIFDGGAQREACYACQAWLLHASSAPILTWPSNRKMSPNGL